MSQVLQRWTEGQTMEAKRIGVIDGLFSTIQRRKSRFTWFIFYPITFLYLFKLIEMVIRITNSFDLSKNWLQKLDRMNRPQNSCNINWLMQLNLPLLLLTDQFHLSVIPQPNTQTLLDKHQAWMSEFCSSKTTYVSLTTTKHVLEKHCF